MKETKEILTDCTLCYHSCGTRVTVEDGKAVKFEGLESHPLNKGTTLPERRKRPGEHLQPRTSQIPDEAGQWSL